jgi:hypothetical protein
MFPNPQTFCYAIIPRKRFPKELKMNLPHRKEILMPLNFILLYSKNE